MAINRDNFKVDFGKFPPWLCPSCSNGTFSPIGDARKVIETGPSKSAHSHEAWDPDWIRERFTDMLECNNCGEIAAISGTVSHFLDYYYGPGGSTEADLIQTLIPQSIIPAPLLFPVPSEVPTVIREEILKAFSLIWLDHEACATKIRTCIELFLDDLKIPKIKKTESGGTSKISLHQRIEEYGRIDKESADFLLAVKWIGNAGSHANMEGLERDDLLNVFDIIDFVLEENYLGRKKRLSEIAAAINAAKGKPPKPTNDFF